MRYSVRHGRISLTQTLTLPWQDLSAETKALLQEGKKENKKTIGSARRGGGRDRSCPSPKLSRLEESDGEPSEQGQTLQGLAEGDEEGGEEGEEEADELAPSAVASEEAEDGAAAEENVEPTAEQAASAPSSPEGRQHPLCLTPAAPCVATPRRPDARQQSLPPPRYRWWLRLTAG